MSAILIVGVVTLLAVTVGAVIYLVLGASARGQQRLATLSSSISEEAVPTQKKVQWQGRQDRAPLITILLQETSVWDALQLQILQAGWLLRPSELIALIVGSGLVGAAVGIGLGQRWIMGGLGLVLGIAIPWATLKAKQATRAKALNTQIPDSMDMLASALRAGFAFMRGLQLIASQMHPPISDEFRRVIEEVQFGVSVTEALDNLVRRTQDYDLELVVAAVQTQLEIGGNLAEILDNIGDMIRERVKLSGEVATATAEGRLSAGILLALPLGVSFMMNIMNPGYMDPLFTTSLGHILLAIGIGLMLLGAIVIAKLVNVDV